MANYFLKRPPFEPSLSVMLCIAFVFFTLWDFYLIGFGRYFDYLGLLVLALNFLFWPNKIRTLPALINDRYFLLAIIGLMLIPTYFSFLGLIHHQFLSSAAVLIGCCFVFYLYFTTALNQRILINVLNALIIINIFAFFLQMLLFHLCHIIFDPTTFLGSIPPRVYNLKTGYFRAAGLFQEPNSYCTNLFMLMTLRTALQRPTNILLKFFSVLTLLLSQSLWGWGACSLFVLLLCKKRERLLLVAVCCVYFFWLIFAGWLSLGSKNTHEPSYQTSALITGNRLATLNEDPSKLARYGTISSYFRPANLEGHGISISGFENIAANGLAFSIYCFGLIYSTLISIALIYLFYRLGRPLLVIPIFFLLTTYPLMTYMIFWAWIALLIRSCATGQLKLEN